LYRLTNYFFGFVVIYLFILEAGINDHALLLSGFLLSGVVAYIAFLGNWITLDATKAVIVLGTIVLGFGGWILAITILFFFVSGSIFTHIKRDKVGPEHKKQNTHSHLHKRRDGYQVWANGFWPAVFCIAWFLFSAPALLAAAFAAVAAATADTWATEIGTIKPGKTFNIISMEPVEPGTDGGISLKGSLAAAAGALLIASFVFPSDFLAPSGIFFIVFLCGLAGCFVDSVLGAVVNDSNLPLPVPGDFSGSTALFTNSFVNWASTGLSGILVFLIVQLLF
jgi:uncharacterized protein (TIGR00297 family)